MFKSGTQSVRVDRMIPPIVECGATGGMNRPVDGGQLLQTNATFSFFVVWNVGVNRSIALATLFPPSFENNSLRLVVGPQIG